MRKQQVLSVDWQKVLTEQPRLTGESQTGWLKRISNGKFQLYRTSFYRHKNKFRDADQYKTDIISTDKKEADFHWRSPIKHFFKSSTD